MNQVKKNLLLNILSFLVNIAIGLFYTPYLVNTLGILAYGILPLAMIINQYISVLSTSLTGSLTRFYAVEINNNNFEKASHYLKGTLQVMLIIGAFSLVLFVGLIFKSNVIFNIPEEFEVKAKILFSFTAASFLLSLISSLFNVVLYSGNRLDLLNYINIIRTGFRCLLIVILFNAISVDLVFVGAASFIAEFVIVLYSFYLFNKLKPKEVSVANQHIEKTILYSIFGMTIWVIIHQLGDMAIYKTDILFVNKFWGVTESGVLSALSDLGSYAMVIVTVLSSLFGPLILIAYSKSNHEEVKKLLFTNSLVIGLIMSLIVGILIGYSPEFIKLWLGKEYSQYYLWLSVKVSTLPFYASAGVFSFVYRSWNKVRIPSIVTVMLGIILIPIDYVICKYFSRGIISMLIANATISIVQTYGLGIYMIRLIYPESKAMILIINGVKILILMILMISLSILFKNYFIINTWLHLIFGILLISIVGSLLILVILGKEQRKYATQIILQKNGF